MTGDEIRRAVAFLRDAITIRELDGYRPGDALPPDVEQRLERLYAKHFGGGSTVPGQRAGDT